MVAYNFHKIFAPQVEQRLKNQTVRAERKRHARVGEGVQLFTAQRTKYCRKLVDPDPVCVKISPVEIRFTNDIRNPIAMIAINECTLSSDEQVKFAIADGFGLKWHADQLASIPESEATPLVLMGRFWVSNHGWEDFHGQLITWSPFVSVVGE